jgi:DNA repair exonuclease SbcCD ATPase subunit
LETEQIDKRVSWLDEQRRKDAEELTRLEERLEALDQSANQQAKQLRDLAGELARISALEARIRQFDETIAKHRSEILQQLETQDERRIAREKQLESMRSIDQKKGVEQVDELRAKLKVLDPISDALETRKKEEMRISRAADILDKKVDQIATDIDGEKRSVAGIREARDKDSLRINELEARVSALVKKVDELRGFIDASEDQLRKLAIRSGELELSERELRQSQNLWTEQQSARLAEFERAWNAWEKRFADFEIQSDQLQERMESYEETHRGVRLLRDELKDVIERLDRRIAEVSEIQRLSEDRFKQEWSTFQADEQKRWSSFKLSSDEQWKEHERQHRPIPEQIKELQDRLESSMASIDELDRLSKGRITDLVAMMQDWEAELRDGDA